MGTYIVFRSSVIARLNVFRTGEEFASRLAKEGARYGLKGIVADPEECEMEELTQVIGVLKIKVASLSR